MSTEEVPPSPPEAWEPLLRLARMASQPLERFLRIQAASGVVLLVVAVAALAIANSSWSTAFSALWHTPVGVAVGAVGLLLRRNAQPSRLSWSPAVRPVEGGALVGVSHAF